MSFTEISARKLLQQEGFNNIYVWTDAPNEFYNDHMHSKLTAHIILKGAMALTVSGKTRVLNAGDRFDVPAGIIHSARVGKKGCTYVVAEK